MLRKRSSEVNEAICSLYEQGDKPGIIHHKLETLFPGLFIKREDIYNEIRTLKKKGLVSGVPNTKGRKRQRTINSQSSVDISSSEFQQLPPKHTIVSATSTTASRNAFWNSDLTPGSNANFKQSTTLNLDLPSANNSGPSYEDYHQQRMQQSIDHISQVSNIQVPSQDPHYSSQYPYNGSASLKSSDSKGESFPKIDKNQLIGDE